jgi:hypothetical protein
MSSKPTIVPKPPTLDECHSGIPDNLLSPALQVKARLAGNQDLTPHERKELPVVPLGHTREEFMRAVSELAHILGQQNIEINDKPLDDGW